MIENTTLLEINLFHDNFKTITSETIEIDMNLPRKEAIMNTLCDDPYISVNRSHKIVLQKDNTWEIHKKTGGKGRAIGYVGN